MKFEFLIPCISIKMRAERLDEFSDNADEIDIGIFSPQKPKKNRDEDHSVIENLKTVEIQD